MSPPLLTAREVADMLGVHPETVLRWSRRGELPAIRLPGGAIRFRPDMLDGWLEERAALRRGEVSPTPRAERRPPGSYRRIVGVVTHPEGEEN